MGGWMVWGGGGGLPAVLSTAVRALTGCICSWLRCFNGVRPLFHVLPGSLMVVFLPLVRVGVLVSNEAPTNVFLSGTLSVPENSAINTVVGSLSASDPDASQTFAYSLTNNGGGRFSLSGVNLVVLANIDFELTSSILVTVTVTDQGGLSFARTFTITVVRSRQRVCAACPGLSL